MYHYNGNPLRLDKAFTDADGNQYPKDWLRQSSQEQRDALGITWVAPDPTEYYDQRFYWGVGNPKDLAQLQEQWVAKQKEIAQSLLRPTDWAVIRGMEDPGKPVGLELKNYRADVRSTSSAREVQIEACVDVDELAALLTSPAEIYDEELDAMVANIDPFLAPWPEGPAT
jgi:hypothetical protein